MAEKITGPEWTTLTVEEQESAAKLANKCIEEYPGIYTSSGSELDEHCSYYGLASGSRLAAACANAEAQALRTERASCPGLDPSENCYNMREQGIGRSEIADSAGEVVKTGQDIATCDWKPDETASCKTPVYSEFHADEPGSACFTVHSQTTTFVGVLSGVPLPNGVAEDSDDAECG